MLEKKKYVVAGYFIIPESSKVTQQHQQHIAHSFQNFMRFSHSRFFCPVQRISPTFILTTRSGQKSRHASHPTWFFCKWKMVGGKGEQENDESIPKKGTHRHIFAIVEMEKRNLRDYDG